MEKNLYGAHRAAMAVYATVMWEFFSYFGMKALFILYLVQSLHLSDSAAYSIFGAYIALVFLTPIIGGFIADKILGFKLSVIIGCLLIITGHCVLGLTQGIGLYAGLALLILGVGFFKTNAICLVADCYQHFPKKKESAYVWYYVAANFGATLGPLVCAAVAAAYGWHWGFAMAGIGMLLGLLVLLSQRRYLQHFGQQQMALGYARSIGIGLASILAFALIVVVLLKGWSSWVLIITGLFALPLILSIYKTSDKNRRKHLGIIFFATLLGTVFWAFDQQGGSSISLFILRDVSKQLGHFSVPTAWFQSINPAVILIAGPVIAVMWRVLAKRSFEFDVLIKVCAGLFLLAIGFGLFISGASLQGSSTNMLWPVMGLILIGVAELFIDPVILNEINQSAPEKSRGFLTGLYYLFVGAYANYASIQVAKLSVYFTKQAKTSSVIGYIHEFEFVFVAVAALIVIGLVGRLLLKTKGVQNVENAAG